MSNRLFYVAQYFTPEPYLKDINFIKSLKDKGWDPVVITGFPNYPKGEIYSGYKNSLFTIETKNSEKNLAKVDTNIALPWYVEVEKIDLKKKQALRDVIEAKKMKIEWGSQIRNYVMHPYKLVKDVRTGHETSDVDSVMNGNIDPFLKAFLMMMGQKEEE